MSEATPAADSAHRLPAVAVVDFDASDADLLPALLRHPGILVRLAVGTDPGDLGLRAAELCGVRCTTDLADLTREIFDLALIGERSPRRDRVARLLVALGTAAVSPREFLGAPAPRGPAAAPAEAGTGAAAEPGLRAATEELAGALERVLPALGPGAEEPVAAGRERDTAAPTPDPGAPSDWLAPADFAARLAQAIDRNRRAGVGWSVHRLRFEGPAERVDDFCRRLPARLRATDAICRPEPRQVLILAATPGARAGPLRRRLAEAWERGWRQGAASAPAPPVAADLADLAGPAEAAAFRATTAAWLAGDAGGATPAPAVA